MSKKNTSRPYFTAKYDLSESLIFFYQRNHFISRLFCTAQYSQIMASAQKYKNFHKSLSTVKLLLKHPYEDSLLELFKQQSSVLRNAI